MFKDNYADDEGGAISSSDVSDHSMYLTNCCFVSNRTNTTDGGGGAICMAWDTDTQIVNCVFTGNEAGYGGAVQMGRNDDGTRLTNCTFYNNKASTGDGGALWASSASPRISNCILWGNTAGGDGNDIFLASTAKYTTFGHCDVNECGGSGGGWDPNFGTDGGWNTEGDPCFAIDDPEWPEEDGPEGPDGNWGTDDDGLMLGPDSACINAAAFWKPVAVWLDVIGRVRKDVSPYPDMGAYESGYKVIVVVCWIDEAHGQSYYEPENMYMYNADLGDYEELVEDLWESYIVKSGCIVPPYEETGYEGNIADVLPKGFFGQDPVPDYVKPEDPPVGISIAECGRPPEDVDEFIADFERIRDGVGPDCVILLADNTVSLGGFYGTPGLGSSFPDFKTWLEEWLRNHDLDPEDPEVFHQSVFPKDNSEDYFEEQWIKAVTLRISTILE